MVSFRREFESSSAAPSELRDELRALLPVDLDADVAFLVGSELIANAVRHGSPPVEASASLDAGFLYLEVFDGDPAMGQRATDSRGLQIIEQLATAWGVRTRPDGKSVWARLWLGPAVDAVADHREVE